MNYIPAKRAKNLSMSNIRKSKIFELSTTILQDLSDEETLSKHILGCSSTEIERALNNDQRTLKNLVIPTYKHLSDLIIQIVRQSGSNTLNT